MVYLVVSRDRLVDLLSGNHKQIRQKVIDILLLSETVVSDSDSDDATDSGDGDIGVPKTEYQGGGETESDATMELSEQPRRILSDSGVAVVSSENDAEVA